MSIDDFVEFELLGISRTRDDAKALAGKHLLERGISPQAIWKAHLAGEKLPMIAPCHPSMSLENNFTYVGKRSDVAKVGYGFSGFVIEELPLA